MVLALGNAGIARVPDKHDLLKFAGPAWLGWDVTPIPRSPWRERADRCLRHWFALRPATRSPPSQRGLAGVGRCRGDQGRSMTNPPQGATTSPGNTPQIWFRRRYPRYEPAWI